MRNRYPNPIHIFNAIEKDVSVWRKLMLTGKLILSLPKIYRLLSKVSAFKKKSFHRVLADYIALIWKYHGGLASYHGFETLVDGYFSERIFEESNSIHDYMLQHEAVNIFWVSSLPSIKKIKEIENKISGWKFLTKHGFPTTTRIGQIYVHNGQVNWSLYGDKNHLPLSCLFDKYSHVFIKPDTEEGGVGCAVLASNEENELFLDGVKISEKDLMEKLYAPFLIEEIVSQEEEISDFHPASLNTLRLITMCNPDTGELYVDRAIFRMGVGGSKTDNWCSGGISVRVYSDGTLDKYAYYYSTEKAPCIQHPDSGIMFEGYQMPHFDEACQLVLSIHRKVKRINGIGWDVAFSDKGLIIVEMNPFFSVFQAQCGGLRKLVYERYLPLAKKNCEYCNQSVSPE